MQEVISIHFLDIEENEKLNNFVNNVINKCFEEEGLDKLNFYISITLTTPNQIRKLNNEYRNIDKETDVLSFPMFEKQEIDEIIRNSIKLPITEILGDIIISIERVKQQAIEYRT